jgi:hypothetical protein
MTDGTVHWGTAAGRQDESALLHPTPGLETNAPGFIAGTARAIDALRGPCSLPWFVASDLPNLPPAIHTELLPDPAATRAACAQVAAVHGEWRTHIDDIRVFVQGNGHLGILSSTFNVEGADTDGGGRLVLGPVHVEIVPEAH